MPPGDFPDPGIEPLSPVAPAGRFFTAEPRRKPLGIVITIKKNLSLGTYVSFFLSSSFFQYACNNTGKRKMQGPLKKQGGGH